MPRRIRKSEREKFKQGALALLQRYGAVPSDHCRDWQLASRYGSLFATVYSDSETSLGWVACCFPDLPAETANYIGANPYSGKWNHHYFDCAAEDALRDLAARFRSVMPIERTEAA